MSTVLKGAALAARARELNIPGRSRMTADELRTMIAALSGPRDVVPPQGGGITFRQQPSAQVEPLQDNQVEPLQDKIISVKVPFRARNGKRKPSIHRKNRH